MKERISERISSPTVTVWLRVHGWSTSNFAHLSSNIRSNIGARRTWLNFACRTRLAFSTILRRKYSYPEENITAGRFQRLSVRIGPSERKTKKTKSDRGSWFGRSNTLPCYRRPLWQDRWSVIVRRTKRHFKIHDASFRSDWPPTIPWNV